MQGIKHLIKCKCILPQYKAQQIFHKFVVFSVADVNNSIQPKLVQCNNCDAIHKITELCQSEIIEKQENLSGVLTIDDLKINLPQNINDFLTKLNVEIYVWEEINFIIKHKMWGSRVLLTSEMYDDYTCGKQIIINGSDDFEVETYNEKIFINS